MSCSWCQHAVGGTGSRGHWVRDPRCSRAEVHLLVGWSLEGLRAGTGLLVCWLGSDSAGYLGTDLYPVLGGVRFKEILGLVPPTGM